jgi:hypothetical protein
MEQPAADGEDDRAMPGDDRLECDGVTPLDESRENLPLGEPGDRSRVDEPLKSPGEGSAARSIHPSASRSPVPSHYCASSIVGIQLSGKKGRFARAYRRECLTEGAFGIIKFRTPPIGSVPRRGD